MSEIKDFKQSRNFKDYRDYREIKELGRFQIGKYIQVGKWMFGHDITGVTTELQIDCQYVVIIP